MKRCVLSLERNIGKEDEFRVSGGSEFQSRGPMTEKALLPSDDLTYGMERTSESEDLVETECDGNERLLIIIIMNFYSPVSNTRCHSIGHKMRIARIKIRVDSQGRWERA